MESNVCVAVVRPPEFEPMENNYNLMNSALLDIWSKGFLSGIEAQKQKGGGAGAAGGCVALVSLCVFDCGHAVG